jgi:hypothetical protein
MTALGKSYALRLPLFEMSAEARHPPVPPRFCAFPIDIPPSDISDFAVSPQRAKDGYLSMHALHRA